MSRASLEGMLEAGGASDAVLEWHLTGNHFPPIVDGVAFARLALERVEAGRGDQPLETEPDARTPRRAPSAFAVVEAWHLSDFLEGGVENGR